MEILQQGVSRQQMKWKGIDLGAQEVDEKKRSGERD